MQLGHWSATRLAAACREGRSVPTQPRALTDTRGA
jgi:hypothetical protein